MTQRDDDPAHPNYDGIMFQAVTDRTGIVCTPTSAQTAPPVTYMPLAHAKDFSVAVRALVADLHMLDPANYAASYFEDMADDLDAAIRVCDPEYDPTD